VFHEKTAQAARGKWRGILAEIGIPESYLRNKHGPCPICNGGTDRFRFDDKEGKGSWICSVCGAGDGMELAIRFTGQSFKDVAPRIDAIVGNLRPDTLNPRPAMTEEDRKRSLRAVWTATAKSAPGDLVHRYLAERGISEVPDAIRFAAKLNDGEGGVRPAMVALVSGPDGKPATLHRTFLKPDGSGKAEMGAPRKLMPGPVPDGSAIRLGPVKPNLGIAEGIETALAASALFELPVWAVINTALMKSWQPPEGVEDVCIFADFDAGFAGQAAAYALAHRLTGKVDVSVKLPPAIGDWNDVLRKEVA
jgi:putative DNA primase/helicase